MNFVLDKLVKLSNFLGVNGPGPSKEGGLEISGSWLTEVLAWLADAVVKIATVIWGWLITIFYVVVRFCLNIIDILQMFAEKLVGIEVYNQEGGLGAVKKLEDTDIIIRFITNEGVIKTFGTICILGIILLIIFSILALVKQNYNAAITDGADGAKKSPRDVLKYAGRGIFMCLLVPFLIVFGILGSNAVLASVCNAIRGDNKLTIGGIIYTASAYEANKFREYANDGLRVPIVETQATEVVVPADYRDQQDMQVLFYKLAKGTIYIKAISDDEWFKNNISNYQTWANEIEVQDIDMAIEKIAGSDKLNVFRDHFNEWYKHYFNAKESLAELGMFNKYINSIYSSNWTANKKYVNKTYDFSSTYKTSQKVNFNSIKYDREDEYLPNNQGLPIYGDAIVADVIVNSSTYTGHENFAPIELEYYVMADMIDFAIEQGMTLYYVNANHENIKWSDIDLDPDSEKDEIVDIKEYNSEFIVTELPSGVGGTSYGLSAYSKQSGKSLEEYVKDVGGELIATSAFAVRYYNGLSRLYWSETGATSEQDGATFIICYKANDTAGTYIPVTQETTKFKSNFLAEDYTGPVVARGIFQAEGVIPKDYCLPTAIAEQVVDANGRELIGFNKISPFAITDTYDPATEDGAFDKIGEFCGRLGDLTGSALFTVLEKTMQAADNVINEWKNWLANDLVQALGEDDVTGADQWELYRKMTDQSKASKTPYKSEQAYNDEITETTTVRTGNLLINPNIAGYTYTAYGDTKDDNGEFLPKSVMFYDENGRKISAGTGYKDANGGDLIEIPIANSAKKDDFNKTSYVVLQMSSFNDVVVPWYFADGGNLTSIIQAIASNNDLKIICKDYTYLIAEYTYDNIQIKLGEGTDKEKIYRMLLDFNVTGLYEIRPGDSGIGEKETSGEFVVTDTYQTIAGVNFVVEKKANLVVSNGEIFYSNGTRFFGREEAKKLYTDYFDNYIKDLFTTSLIGYIDNANASVNTFKILNQVGAVGPAGAFETFLTDLKNAGSQTERETAWETLYSAGSKEWGTGLENLGKKKEAIAKYIMKFLSASEYRAGLASFITKFDEAYYTNEEKITTEKVNDKVVEKLNGTIKFYNQNNQVVGSQIEYTEKNRVENNKITLNLAVVGGANYSTNISYVTIIDEDSQRSFVSGEFAHSAIDDIIDAINTQAGTPLLPVTTGNTYASRYVWYYDVTYTFSYDEYLYKTSDVDRGIVGAYGLTIDDVKVDYTEKKSDGAPEPPKNLLRSRNGGIFSDILGKYILTSDGATKYIENNISKANGVSGEIVSAKFDYIKANGEPGSGLSAGSRLLKINSKTISVEPRSEYNNFYTYFVRGNYKWIMLFDFCIHLPTISFSPKLDFDFAFRFRLGTAYNYAESVLWRLQAGQFYLDYNFRSAVGIGQANIYRMSAINPFLLIFSTALVTTILWTTIWGLIKRIYEVVLLFLMLPAVCATMPIDEGARFGKWTKELMDKIFAAYSVLIMLNLYFVLIPIVKDVTSDLITLGDIPNTITGMFGAISTAISSFGGWISGLGSKMTGAISSFGGKIGGLVGNIGMNNFLLELESAELTNAQQALLGHVNSIIYIMFFLVLTTLLRGGGKGILEDVLSIGKLDGEKTLGEVKATTDSVRKSPMIELPKKAIKATAQLAGNAVKLVGGAVAGVATGSPQAAKAVWGTMEKVDVPKMADLDPSGGQNRSGDGASGVGERNDIATGVDGGTSAESTPAYTPASKTVSRFDNHGEVELDERYKKAEEEYGDKSDKQISKSIKGFEKERDNAVFAVIQQKPEEGVLPEDMDGMTYDQYVTARNNAKTDEEKAKLDQVRFAYAEIEKQIRKISREFKEKIQAAQHYMKVRVQNAVAAKKRAETIAREQKEREGMTDEQKKYLDNLFEERASLSQVKGMVDDNYSGVERENAHREVDAEIEKINKRIDNLMAEIRSSGSRVAVSNTEDHASKTTEKVVEIQIEQQPKPHEEPPKPKTKPSIKLDGGNMGLTDAQNADFNRKLIRASQGIKGEKSIEELKQMSSTGLRELFDKKIASYEKVIEKAKGNKSIPSEEIERKQAGVGKYKEVFDSVVSYQQMRETNAQKLERQAEIKQAVKETIGAGFRGMATAANVVSDVAHIMLGLDKKEKNTKPSEETTTTINIETVTETVEPKEEQNISATIYFNAPNTEPKPIKPTEIEKTPITESVVNEGDNISANQTEKSSKKSVGKTIGDVAKTVGTMTLASLVVPPPVVLATVGGVMAYKGGKKAVNKVKEGLADNPRAKAIAKNTAALLVGGPIGLGAYSIGKAIGKKIKESGPVGEDNEKITAGMGAFEAGKVLGRKLRRKVAGTQVEHEGNENATLNSSNASAQYEEKIDELQSQINTLDAKVDEVEKKVEKNSANPQEKEIVATPTEIEKIPITESVVNEGDNISAKQTEKSSKKSVGKTIGDVAKTVGTMTLASLVIPPPVVLATVGGVMAYKGGKKAVNKVKEGLADNPRAKAIAKNTAALLVGGPIGLGAYSIGKAISKGSKKKRLKNEIDSLKREDTDIKDDQKKMQQKDVIYENKIKNLQSQINTLDAKVDEVEKKVEKNSANPQEKEIVATPTERKKTTTKVVIKTAPKVVKNTPKKSDEDLEKIAETIAKGINKGIETAKKAGEFVKEVGKIIITPTEKVNRQASASKVQAKNTRKLAPTTAKSTPKLASTTAKNTPKTTSTTVKSTPKTASTTVKSTRKTASIKTGTPKTSSSKSKNTTKQK